MMKGIFLALSITYCCYAAVVDTFGAGRTEKPTEQALGGLSIWQQKNCQSCHQLYGLGGYMGPDLTNVISDSARGPMFARAFIQGGSLKMPNFNFTKEETDQLIAFLTWVDKSGHSIVPESKVTPLGNYKLDNH